MPEAEIRRAPDRTDGAPPPSAMLRALRRAEFVGLRELIEGTSGIRLTDGKQALVAGRLQRRLRARGLDSYADYLEIVRKDPEELQQMLECIATGETRFFREPDHFRFLDEVVMPSWERQRAAGLRTGALRIWSAACSTGEEPYSIAMAVLSRLRPADGWSLEILATDLSRASLDRARGATWRIDRAEEIPQAHRKKYLLRGTGPQAGSMRVGPQIRSVVRFQQLNLHHFESGPWSPFDLIFCRNVLMYFSQETRQRITRNLLHYLVPNGHLFLGHAETLVERSDALRCVRPTIYQLTGTPA